MNVTSEHSRPIWGELALRAPPLRTDMETEIAVIGSGIAGMSVAYELACAGKHVAVFDRGAIGGGMTGRTTAHLSSYCDDSFRSLIGVRGLNVARAWRESQAAAISRIETIQRDLSFSCEFRRLDGYLFAPPGTDPSVLDDELVASAQAGMVAVQEEGLPFTGREQVRALRFPDQATFHPLKYLAALAVATEARRGRFFADTPITSIEELNGGVRLTTRKGLKIDAASVVVATNAPINDRLAIHAKQAPYRTYVVAFEVPRGCIPDALYWDTLDPYHYVRLQQGAGEFDIVIVGGEDHRTGESNDGVDRILSLACWARDLVPDLRREVARWSGQVLEPMDYVAFIGRSPGDKRVYVATGDSGQGITHGVVAGMLISDLILRDESPWTAVYDPARKPLKAIGDFVKENAVAAMNFAEYLASGEKASVEELGPGEGAIIRSGLHKIAAYRNEDGVLSQCSASCTHLGCHVKWNSFERCWDCPCHGSQFAPDGAPLSAPAVTPLTELEG
jgi:glycine/D-amino acid oxidase-like deaminating enzyme/nitrite reductase/ring-hydroxylating ferredoxin subunit